MDKIRGGEKLSGKKKCVGGWHHAVVERRREEDAALRQGWPLFREDMAIKNESLY